MATLMRSSAFRALRVATSGSLFRPFTTSFPTTVFPTSLDIHASDLPSWHGEVLVVPLTGDEHEQIEVPNDLQGSLRAGARHLKAGEWTVVHAHSVVDDDDAENGTSHDRSVVVAARIEPSELGFTLANIAKQTRCRSMGLLASPSLERSSVFLQDMLHGLYTDNRFKTGGDEAAMLESFALLLDESCTDQQRVEVREDGEKARQIAEGVWLCRDMVHAPPNSLHPRQMAELAKDLAAVESLEAKVYEREEIQAMGMGAYLGVAKAGATEVGDPRFIHLTYKPAGPVDRRIVLIGKGLTFDSGGYNLKAGPGSMIEKMKFDMGGAGAVLGAAKAIGSLRPAGVEVHFIVAACENLISNDAVKPGDVLTASNGRTIEVTNTDAEGRLTMADALVFAEKLEPDEIVDIATLTGACVVGLGDRYAGLMSTDDDLCARLEHSAAQAGELVWRLPLAAEYAGELKSSIADLKNSGDRAGGAITAGPVWNDKAGGPTGFGVKLLVEYVSRNAGISK